MPDSRVEKWQRWLDAIQPEVISMHWYRVIYRTLSDITTGANLPPSHFFTFVGETYAQTQSVAVRRQVESSGRVVSLGALMREMSDDSTRLTRKLYVSMYDEHIAELANPDFDRLAGQGANHVPQSAIDRDLRDLRDAARPISDYVSRHLAHVDRDPLPAIPTYVDLNAAIDGIGTAFNQCSRILRAAEWATLEPVVQYDWTEVFRVPWITESRRTTAPAPTRTRQG